MLRLFRFASVVALLAVAATASAQFGHPLKGSWSGNWGTSNSNRQHVVLNLNWDGKTISGVINPGPNAVALTTATLDPSTWTVHFEGDGKDKNGATVHYVIDGKVENLGSMQRFITGTWTEGPQKGTFKVTRN
ncbi:MAG TPA: hypothetical protein VLV86_03830 [Vicinamibacterales bacterium]|nr:hypothetical protein [Vicinamibacterales bacterium]